MRLPALLALAVLIPSHSEAQSNETPLVTSPHSSSVAKELRELHEALAEQQAQIRRQQIEIEMFREQLPLKNSASHAADISVPRVMDATLHESGAVIAANAVAVVDPRSQEPSEKTKDSPLSFSIGVVQFTPGGTIDFTSVFRTTDVGSGVGTTFGSIPFNNTAAGQLSEDRLTAQNSKVILRVTSKFGGNDIKDYL
jgi:hypothetical protein